MLTAERVKDRTWRYGITKQDPDTQIRYAHNANFEVLAVGPDGKLGIFITAKSTEDSRLKGPDLSDLEDLTLDKLEQLVGNKFVWELQEESAESGDSSFLIGVTWIFSLVVGFSGWFTFLAGIHVHAGQLQKPWEVATGAAMMIAALLAVALRRA